MYAEGGGRSPGAVGAVPSCIGLEGAESLRPVNACAGAQGNGSQSGSQESSSGSLDTMEVPAGAALALRLLIAAVYLAVCAVGLVGNVLVMVLVRARQKRRPSALNCFVLNLAATDFQFVLTLPFWAVDTARDFSWPFGSAMCKIVLSLTVLNMYASAFFLSAMSIARYFTVACALRRHSLDSGGSVCCGRATPGWVCGLLWVAASLATAPTALFSTVASVAGERLCLLRFPDGGWDWLALYHVQKITVAFLLPLATLSACYLLLVRFVRSRPRPWLRGAAPGSSGTPSSSRGSSRVTRSVTVVVLAFFLCWLPNHAITLWGVLVKFNAVPWDRAYYLVHSYLFPVTICLAHANSCLNPLLYCLLRPEFRQLLWELCCRRCRRDRLLSTRSAKGGPASSAPGPAPRQWRSSSRSESPQPLD